MKSIFRPFFTLSKDVGISQNPKISNGPTPSPSTASRAAASRDGPFKKKSKASIDIGQSSSWNPLRFLNPFSEKNSALFQGLAHKSQAEKYDAKAQLAEKRADRQHRPELVLKFRQEALEAHRLAAAERRQAIAWIQKTLKADPSNAAVQRELADLLLLEGEERQAKKHLTLAVTYEKDPDGFRKTVALAQRIQDPEIGNGWDFVIDRLKKENRPEEASIVSKLGYGGPQYFMAATSPSSKLYQSLLRVGISREAIDGSRKGPSRARHIWNYVGEHFQEAPVRKALASAGIPVDFLPKDVIGSKPKGAWFGEALAAHYSEKAAQTQNARKKEELLALAVHYRPGHSAEYVALGEHFFSHKNYTSSLKAYEAGISAGMTEGAYLGAGRCHVMMGELAKAHDVYADYMRFDSRSAAARTARLEINLIRSPGASFLPDQIQNQVQYEIVQDRAMLRFLNPAADREELKSLSTDLDDRKAMALEKRAQEFLFLGNLAQSRPEDAEDLGEHYGNLAKDSYLALHDWLQKSPDPKAQELALFYLANSYAAEGNVEKAEQTYQAVVDTAAPRFVYGNQYIGDTEVEKGKHALDRIIGKKEGEAMVARGRDLIETGKSAGDSRQVEKGEDLIREGEYRIRICHPYTEEPSPAVLEAAAKLKRLSDDKTRSFHLAALDFWEGIVDEQAKIAKTGEFKMPSIGGGKIKVRFDEGLEKKLITDVRERLVTSEDHSLSLNEAIAETALKHPNEELRNYAEQYLTPNDAVDGRPANVIGYLLAYAGSGFPPAEDAAQRLLGIGEANERKGQGQIAMGAYGFVKIFSEKNSQKKAEKLIRLASGHGSFLENVERAVDAMSPEEIARDVVLFGAIGKVGTVARIAMASRLSEAGMAGWKVWLFSHTAEVVTAGTGFFFYGIHQELQNGGDPDKVLSSGHLARRYGASLLMLGLTKVGGGAGTLAGENQIAQWGFTHAGSFLGMASSSYASRLLGLEEGSVSDWAPLANAGVFYLTYAAGGAVMNSPAPRGIEPVSLKRPVETQKRVGTDGSKPVDAMIDVATRNHIRAVEDAFVKSFPDMQGQSVNGRKLNEAVSVVKSDGVHICVRGAKSKAQWIDYLSGSSEAKATGSPDVFEFYKDGVSFRVRVEVDTEMLANAPSRLSVEESTKAGRNAPPRPGVPDETVTPKENGNYVGRDTRQSENVDQSDTLQDPRPVRRIRDINFGSEGTPVEDTQVMSKAAKRSEKLIPDESQVQQVQTEKDMLVSAKRVSQLWNDIIDLRKDISELGQRLKRKQLTPEEQNELNRKLESQKEVMRRYEDELEALIDRFRLPAELSPASPWERTLQEVTTIQQDVQSGIEAITSACRSPWSATVGMEGEPIAQVRDQISSMTDGHLNIVAMTEAIFSRRYEGREGSIEGGILKIGVKRGGSVEAVADAVIHTLEKNKGADAVPEFLKAESSITPTEAVLIFNDPRYPDVFYEVRIEKPKTP